VSPSHGSISPENTEQRVFATVDWSKLDEGLSEATINFTAVSGNPPTTLLVPAFIVANKTSAPSTFKGKKVVPDFDLTDIDQVSSRAEERSPSRQNMQREKIPWQAWYGECCPA
jgi:hypothetical protein